jgi:hypothetical protein
MSIKKNMITYALYIDDELKAEGNAYIIGNYLGIKPISVYGLYKRYKKKITPRKYDKLKIVRTDIFEDE